MFFISTCSYCYLREVEEWIAALILGDHWETEEWSEEGIKAKVKNTHMSCERKMMTFTNKFWSLFLIWMHAIFI